MKQILLLAMAVVLVGCASTPTIKSVAGTYDGKGNTVVFQENGVVTWYVQGKPGREGFALRPKEWKIVNGEIWQEGGGFPGNWDVYRINSDRSITRTHIMMFSGFGGAEGETKRRRRSGDAQITLKKVSDATKPVAHD